MKINLTGNFQNKKQARGACTGCGVEARPNCGHALSAATWPAGRYVYACNACKRRVDTDERFRTQFEWCAEGGVCLAHVEQGFKQAGLSTIPTTDDELMAALANPWVRAALMSTPPPIGASDILPVSTSATAHAGH